jgi:hypothetical protein
MKYEKGDKVILKGAKKNTGIVIEYLPKRKAYKIDRGFKTSEIWECNIIGKESEL